MNIENITTTFLSQQQLQVVLHLLPHNLPPPLNNISHLVTTAITLHSLPRPLHIKTMVIHNILSSHIP